MELDAAPGSAPTLSISPGDPYGGTAAEVPGLVEAEEFDLGGEGVGYSDTTTANIGGVRGKVGGIFSHTSDRQIDHRFPLDDLHLPGQIVTFLICMT